MKKFVSTTLLSVLCSSGICAGPVLAQQTEPLLSTASMPSVQTTSADPKKEDGWWSGMPKEDKMLYTNLGIAAFIGIYGLIDWDYGSDGWNTAHEKWFQEDSKYGGGDKLGHCWSTYVLSDALTALYKSYGYDQSVANTYAAFSAWTVQLAMEVGDATSESQGFSYEDVVMNTVGALTSMLMAKYPELDRKIDFRLEYVFNVNINGIFDDYSNQYYSIVLKPAGFDALADTFMRYIEFHAGYYSRGYDSTEVDKERSFYGGVSINLAQLFHENHYNKVGTFLEYMDIPYSVLKAKSSLD